MNQKKLTRSVSDKKIAGVCGGIAKYFEIDVTIVRLVFALSLLFAGVTFWVYLVMALVLPKEGPVNNQPIDAPYTDADGDSSDVQSNQNQ